MDMTAALGTGVDCHRISEILSRVGDKWTMQVVVVLRGEPRRFNDLKRQVAGISQQMLTRTLKTLARDGMVTRTVTANTPPQVEYALTPLGQDLSEPVRQLAKWATEHLATIDENRRRFDEAL